MSIVMSLLATVVVISILYDKDVSHNDSALLATNPELYNMEICENIALSPHIETVKNGKMREF